MDEGHRRPLVHAALFLAVMLLVWPLVDAGTPWTPDEGVYGTQAAALQDGSWEYEAPSARIDPEGIYEFYGSVPYARHPTYPWVLGATFDLAGPGAGIVWLSVIGAVLAAASAWFVAAELRPGSEPWAFWFAAASPLAFNGFVLWAHAPAAAAAGWAAVGALRAVRSSGRLMGAWVLAGAGSTIALLLRSEGLVFAVALTATLGLVGLVQRQRRIVAGATALLAIVGLATYVENAWSRSTGVGGGAELQGRGGGVLGEVGFLEGRIEGFRRALLDGGVWAESTRTLGLVIFAFVVAAAVSVAVRGIDRVTAWLLAAAGALYVVRVAFDPIDPISGLFVAWPVAVAAALGLTRRLRGDGVATIVVGTVIALFAVGVLATQYADGGALQWGGRFFTPIVPLLAALAASGLRSPPLARTHAAAALLGVAALLTVQGLVELRLNRAEHAEVIAALRAVEADLYMSPIATVVPGSWRENLPWFELSFDEVGEGLDLAAAAGVDEVTLVWGEGVTLDVPGWRSELVRRLPYDLFPLEIYRLTRQ